jgi:FO synthase
MGYSSTLDYAAAAAAAVMAETGLMPHVNAGVMGQCDIERWDSVFVKGDLCLEIIERSFGGGQRRCEVCVLA